MVITKTSIYCSEDFYLSSNQVPFQDKIPPVIGCLISDKDGKSIVSFEVFKGAIQFFMKHKQQFKMDLIPMYVSAIELLSQELNIQGLPGIDINGDNLKLKIYFTFEKFTATLFLNPNIDFSRIEDLIQSYLSNLFEEFDNEFKNSTHVNSNEFITFLERVGLCWLLDLNDEYLGLSQN